MRVKNDITIHEIDGEETKNLEDTLTITNHWNRCNMVILSLPHLKPEDRTISVTVLASDLRNAITNATNVK